MPSSRKKRGRTKGATLSTVLTCNSIMRMTGPVYFGHGEGYLDSRLVGGLVEFDGRITARVRGTSKYEADNPPPGGPKKRSECRKGDLRMNDRALHILRTVFGFEGFRPRQEEVIEHLIAGGDALVLMPTGGGKSLCYQIPAMVRQGTGVVISPLISLMQDQVSALLQSGVRAAFLNSTQDAHEGRRVQEQLLGGELDLLYVAPERLMTPRFLDMLGQAQPALFAIDESHCVSQWGHDFRREYLRLSIFHERFPHVPRIALTATADESTRSEIIKRLGLEKAKVVVSGFDRPNIRYRITRKQKPREQLLRFIKEEHEGDAGIVYCLSRKKVDSTAEWLRERGFTRALPYHAGLSAEVRQRHQSRFLNEEGVIIVATIAFGLGIDKPDVRFVAHLDLPKSIEAYYQETGRAGRDGLPSNAWMAYGMQDIVMLRQMIEGSEADETRKRVERHKLDSLVALCEVSTCRRQALLGYFSEERPDRCGNCDTCMEPVEMWDGTVAAQKALSCVSRTGQRFGAAYVTDVLLGKDSDRIRQFGHDKLSTYGIGKELDAAGWRAVFRQLMARNLLSADVEGFGSLCLTEGSWAVMRGEVKLHLRKEKRQERKREKGRVARRRGHFAEDGDKRLWEALRERRAEIAKEQSVPPYVIFHDTTFAEMVQRRPRDLDGMRLVTGVGERKLKLYGEDFLNIIIEHSEGRREPANDTVAETVELSQKGMDVETIAARRNLKPGTIYSHLATAIEDGAVELKQAVSLKEEEIRTIRDALLNQLKQPEGDKALKPVYEALAGAYDYGVLRCVRAALLREGNK